MDAQITSQMNEIEAQREEIDDCKAIIRTLQNENAMLRRKLQM